MKVNTSMKYLKDAPTIFVHYPIGAGGWFLSSLIYFAYDQSEPFEFDNKGSGHNNRAIQYINNFYKDFLGSKEGADILEDANYENFPQQQRLAYLRDNLLISPLAKDSVPQVISIHCRNINIFLEAFPNSKCIQINITDDQKKLCRFNYLFKILSTTEIHFETFCRDNGLSETEIKNAKVKIQNLKDHFDEFEWTSKSITKLNKTVENYPEFDKRILEIFYNEYINDPADYLLAEICKFLEISLEENLRNDLTGYIFQYRALQPKL
jgi:hypothetical protein